MFLTRITGESDPCEVTEETKVMRNVFRAKQRSWGRRVCVIRRDVTNKQHPAAKREQAERVDRREGAGFHVHV